MLTHFICPDDESIKVEDCMKECRMGMRCLTLPTLAILGKEREFTGTPSTTQLLNGTMYEYLKITNDYGIKPMSRAFALLGTIHHKALEEKATELGITAEISLTGDDRNIFDLLEVEYKNNLPIYTMTDYKTWGSFKVARTLGFKVVGETMDTSGGKPRKKKVFEEVSEEADNFDITMQLNRYKYMLEDTYGINVSKLQVQITVRDGGLQVATTRGINQLIYLRPVAILPKQKVLDYFDSKSEYLVSCLTNKRMPSPWSLVENWEGKRCLSYCEVAEHCPLGRDKNRVRMGSGGVTMGDLDATFSHTSTITWTTTDTPAYTPRMYRDDR